MTSPAHQTVQITAAQTPADYETARGLVLAYQQELGQDLSFQDFSRELQQLPVKYGPPHGCLLLARQGSEVVGCVALQRLSDDTCEMKRFFVSPVARGTGTGRQLATALLLKAARMGYRRMVLDTLDTLRPALHLYEALGFVPIAPYYKNPLEGVIFMEKELPGP